MPQFLNIHQVMVLLQVKSRQTIYNWLKHKKLPQPIKKLGSPRWDAEELRKFVSKTSKVVH